MNALGMAIIASALISLLGWALINRLSRAQSNKCVEKVLKNSGKEDPRALEDPKNGSLVANEINFKITTPEGHTVELFWNEIEEIHGFKKDLFTTDLICLAFKRCGAGELYQIHEEMAGYHDLLQAMRTYLPGFNLNWIVDVGFPAFATKHQVIWKRPALTNA